MSYATAAHDRMLAGLIIPCRVAEAQAKISKEANPEKAKAMLNALEQSLRTGDIFADMQVKAALTAYAGNRDLYEQLKKDSQNAKGILDKNLRERREASAQKWADPRHAQRIISITNRGDKGLIALKACQAYVRAITR